MKSHPFWGVHAPLSSLSGAGLLIIASDRVISALICALALIWIGGVTMLAAGLGRRCFPDSAPSVRGGPPPEGSGAFGADAVLVFLSALAAGIFYLALSLTEPILALESGLFILLSSVFVIGSGLYRRVKTYDTAEMLFKAVSEAFVLGVLIIGFALIREPLGRGTLSLPVIGTIRFMKEGPLRILQVSPGALILFGYGAAVFRYFRNRNTNSEDD
jgi:hypothetical protein